MIETNRAPDDVIQIDNPFRAFGWADRFRILFGCPVRQRMPIALWYEVDGISVRSRAMVPRDGGLTVDRFFSSAALPAADDTHGRTAA